MPPSVQRGRLKFGESCCALTSQRLSLHLGPRARYAVLSVAALGQRIDSRTRIYSGGLRVGRSLGPSGFTLGCCCTGGLSVSSVPSRKSVTSVHNSIVASSRV